jgi:hypothetical protein
MDYTKLSLTNCINLACSTFGLEDTHTIAIARLVDLVAKGYLTEDEATPMAQIIYNHGANSLYYNDEWDEEEDPWDEDEEYINGDEGFDPYMGCYTGDC